MDKKPALQFTRTINAPAAEIFRAFTHATALRDWLSVDARTQPRINGFIFLQWPDQSIVQGVFQQFEPGTALTFSWQPLGDPVPDMIEVLLTPDGSGTQVVLTHTLCQECNEARQQYTLSWLDALENLQSFLEKGLDLRQARRPRMGIIMDELTAEVAERIGAPVKEGVLLYGSAQGSGAEKTGLMKEDILISLDGQPTPNPAALAPILQKHQAGDRIKVEYYRGAALIAAELELSAFPIPELPETAAELAAAARAAYANNVQGIKEITAGLSDKEAAHRPAPKEWSVNEIVAHFILCERDYQSWAADMLNDKPINDSLEYRPNVDGRIMALVNRLGFTSALIHELELAYSESAELLATLPDTFVQYRKHLFRRLADWALIVVPEHFAEEHREQFLTAIESAKKQG